tara:strand:- start:3397 stop:3726 length:330 start_codon:yes stop_codon:yes gene_type:complete
MAETFKNAYKDITNSAQTIYTCPGSTTAIVLTLRITNIDGTNDDTITADVIDASSGNARIASTLAVPADATVELAGTSKIVLEAGDKIDLTGGASSGDLEAFASVLEIT